MKQEVTSSKSLHRTRRCLVPVLLKHEGYISEPNSRLGSRLQDLSCLNRTAYSSEFLSVER